MEKKREGEKGKVMVRCLFFLKRKKKEKEKRREKKQDF